MSIVDLFHQQITIRTRFLTNRPKGPGRGEPAAENDRLFVSAHPFDLRALLPNRKMAHIWRKHGKIVAVRIEGEQMTQAALRSPSLFRNLPREDVFQLFQKNGRPDGKRVVDFLHYNKKDVAVATDISLGSVRYDNRMPDILVERLTEWATAINLVGSFFKDQHRTMLWFQMPNPLLGGMTPKDMIRMGRFKKLLTFIQTALAENEN